MKKLIVVVPLLLSAALAGCGSGPVASPGPTSQPTSGVTPVPTAQQGGILAAGQLCAVFTDLAVGVLGGPLDQPQFGDVVPRPNGVYCHYQLTGDANTNVEVQLKETPRSEAEALAATMGADIAVPGLGELAFRRDSSSFGGGGATLLAWANGVGVTILLNREGAEQAVMNTAVEAIARAVLAASS